MELFVPRMLTSAITVIFKIQKLTRFIVNYGTMQNLFSMTLKTSSHKYVLSVWLLSLSLFPAYQFQFNQKLNKSMTCVRKVRPAIIFLFFMTLVLCSSIFHDSLNSKFSSYNINPSLWLFLVDLHILLQCSSVLSLNLFLFLSMIHFSFRSLSTHKQTTPLFISPFNSQDTLFNKYPILGCCINWFLIYII